MSLFSGIIGLTADFPPGGYARPGIYRAGWQEDLEIYGISGFCLQDCLSLFGLNGIMEEYGMGGPGIAGAAEFEEME